MNFLTDNEIKSKMKSYKNEIERLKKELDSRKGKTEEQMLADELHKMICNINHTDGCSYFYGSWETPSNAHLDYLNRSQKLIKECFINRNSRISNIDFILRIIRISRGHDAS